MKKREIIFNFVKDITYLSYTGMLEPLGRSQVIPYINILGGMGKVHLISFEKNKVPDLVRFDIESEFKSNNFSWTTKVYHKTPRFMATLVDLLVMIGSLLKDRPKKRIHYVHCRGYVTSIAAFIYSICCSRVRYIFDMRAFWPDEMVTSNTLKKNSLMYWLLKKLERILIIRSHATIVLTWAAHDYLLSEYKGASGKVFVVPTCVNHDNFNIATTGVNSKTLEGVTIGAIGTVCNSWFLMDRFCDFALLFQKALPESKIKVITQDKAVEVEKALLDKGIDKESISIYSSSSQGMPGEIKKFHALIMFFAPGFSKLGSAPTRFGEALASGVPCVVNTGVGDMANIVNREKTGVVIGDLFDRIELHEKCQELLKLIDSEVKDRCYSASKKYFSLDIAKKAYGEIYD